MPFCPEQSALIGLSARERFLPSSPSSTTIGHSRHPPAVFVAWASSSLQKPRSGLMDPTAADPKDRVRSGAPQAAVLSRPRIRQPPVRPVKEEEGGLAAVWPPPAGGSPLFYSGRWQVLFSTRPLPSDRQGSSLSPSYAPAAGRDWPAVRASRRGGITTD